MTVIRREGRILHRCRTGFTLVEVLCVVVILGIAAAMVAPAISNSDDINAAAATRTVMADLIYAQNDAINNQEYTYITFDTGAQTYNLADAAQPANDFTRSFGSGATPLADGSLVSASFGTNVTTIAYDPLGEPCAYSGSNPPPPLTSDGTIVIGSGAEQMTISIEADSGELSTTSSQ